MYQFLITLLTVIILAGCGEPSQAAVYVFAPGTSSVYTIKTDLVAFEAAADCVGKVGVISSPVTLTTAVTHKADRGLQITKGGLITTSGAGSLTFAAGATLDCGDGGYQVFGGTGAVTGLKEAKPEWFGGSLKKAFAAAPVVILGNGTYEPDESIYLDSNSTTLCYILRGNQRNSIIKPTSGLNNKYLFYLNEDSSGTKILNDPRHPRMIIDGVKFDGTAATNPSFVWYNNASLDVRNVEFSGALYGFNGLGYTDNMSFDNIFWGIPVAGGYAYKQTESGDGLKVSRLNTSFHAGLYIANSHGAVLDANIGGVHTILNSTAMTIRSGHYEFQSIGAVSGAHTDAPQFTVKNSSVVFESDHFRHDNKDTYTLLVNDDPAVAIPSNIVVKDGSIVKSLADLSGSRLTDIYIQAFNANSTFQVKNTVQYTGIAGEFAGGSKYLAGLYPLGIRVNSAVAAISTALDAYRPRHWAGITLYSPDGTNWSVRTDDDGMEEVLSISNPTLSVAATTITGLTSNVAATTTYYYKVELEAVRYRKTSVSAEASVTLSAGQFAKLTIAGNPRTLVRVHRGTVSGTYTQAQVIPASSGEIVLWDTGSYLSLYAWAGAATPSAANALQYPGSYNKSSGKSVVYATAAPTTGSWVVGDRCVNSMPSAGQPKEWVCTVAGTPGTWVSEGNL